MTILFKRILLVEDNPNDAELTMEALSECGLENYVDIARDGEEALDYLFMKGKFANRPEGNPVVVFLDLKLPKLNGIEVLKKIRSDEGLKYCPVVAFTSSREENDVSECYKFGINAYVVKPVDFDKFLETVKTLGLFWVKHNEQLSKKSVNAG